MEHYVSVHLFAFPTEAMWVSNNELLIYYSCLMINVIDQYKYIGVVTGIEKNHKQQQEAKKGDEVAVKIESSPENAKEYGKHFDHQHEVCSKVSLIATIII